MCVDGSMDWDVPAVLVSINIKFSNNQYYVYTYVIHICRSNSLTDSECLRMLGIYSLAQIENRLLNAYRSRKGTPLTQLCFNGVQVLPKPSLSQVSVETESSVLDSVTLTCALAM